MKAILIDDEIHCIGSLQILIEKYCPDIQIIGTANNGVDGISKIESLDPDLVFLDIEMPKLNGFEMLSKFDNIKFKIIFTTAYDNFAIKAFKVSAVDYLLKPIDKHELVEAVSKAKKVIQEAPDNKLAFYRQQVDSLLENIKMKSKQFPNIALPTLSGLEMIKIEDILYLESDGNYTKLIKINKEEILVSKTLKSLETQLSNYHFVRIHHSHIVNINRISRYIQGEGGYVVLENGQHLNVSRRKKNLLLSSLKL